MLDPSGSFGEKRKSEGTEDQPGDRGEESKNRSKQEACQNDSKRL